MTHMVIMFLAMFTMLKYVLNKYIFISSSMHRSLSLFLHLMLISEDNPYLYKHEVENCIKIVKTFLTTEGFSPEIEIKNVIK